MRQLPSDEPLERWLRWWPWAEFGGYAVWLAALAVPVEQVYNRTHRLLGARTTPISSDLLFPGSASCWRNSAYAVSSDRQAA